MRFISKLIAITLLLYLRPTLAAPLGRRSLAQDLQARDPMGQSTSKPRTGSATFLDKPGSSNPSYGTVGVLRAPPSTKDKSKAFRRFKNLFKKSRKETKHAFYTKGPSSADPSSVTPSPSSTLVNSHPAAVGGASNTQTALSVDSDEHPAGPKAKETFMEKAKRLWKYGPDWLEPPLEISTSGAEQAAKDPTVTAMKDFIWATRAQLALIECQNAIEETRDDPKAHENTSIEQVEKLLEHLEKMPKLAGH